MEVMMSRQYMIIRGELLSDPAYTLDTSGREMVRLRVGVRMPGGLVEPVQVQACDVMPDYCRHHRTEQGDLIIVSGWANTTTTIRNQDNDVLVCADMIAADTSTDWKPS